MNLVYLQKYNDFYTLISCIHYWIPHINWSIKCSNFGVKITFYVIIRDKLFTNGG